MYCPHCGNFCNHLSINEQSHCYYCDNCGGHYIFEALEYEMAKYSIPMALENCPACNLFILEVKS